MADKLYLFFLEKKYESIANKNVQSHNYYLDAYNDYLLLHRQFGDEQYKIRRT